MLNDPLDKIRANRNTTLIFFLCLFSLPLALYSQNDFGIKKQTTSFVYEELCIPSPSLEAQALYKYLQYIYGEKILSGQMTTPQLINELEYIMFTTGKEPAIRGFDLSSERANNLEIETTIKWWEKGGIPFIMWNWSAPSYGVNNGNSQKEVAIEKIFQEGTPEYEAFWQELKIKADHLDSLRRANVPVLWCPFHEANSNLFWWGKQGSSKFIQLWHAMFKYFTHERKLNNLIWVQCFSDEITSNWYPGDGYVDIVAASSEIVDSKFLASLFNKANTLANSNVVPLALNQCTTIPNPDECREMAAMWCWWMKRPDVYLSNTSNSYLNEVYYNDLTVTLNKIPDIVNDFSKETVKRYFYSGSTIPFSALKQFSLGRNSGRSSIKNDQMEIEAKGNGMSGVKDEGFFAFKQLEGDFDISVQVLSLSAADSYSMAGLMARADLSKTSPHVYFHVFPNNDTKINNSRGCELKYRTAKSKQTMGIYPNSIEAGNKFDMDFPNTWIRLKRRGNLYKSYISNDNINWYLYSVHKQEMPEKLLVGIAIASHNKNRSTKAEFKDLEITWE
jgi:mannan endo-1,4-beta-mannosidase